jgi:hypothetical protein
MVPQLRIMFKVVSNALATPGILWSAILVAVRDGREGAASVGLAVATGVPVPVIEILLLSKDICAYNLLLNKASRVVVS